MAVQTPAQRAANKAFHNREEKKKGKRAPPKEKVDKNAQEARPKPTRKHKKNKKVEISWGLWLIIFAIIGGILIELLFLINSSLLSGRPE